MLKVAVTSDIRAKIDKLRPDTSGGLGDRALLIGFAGGLKCGGLVRLHAATA